MPSGCSGLWPGWAERVALCWTGFCGTPLALVVRSAALPEPPDVPLLQAIQSSTFAPSGRRTLDSVLTLVGAGNQPRGWRCLSSFQMVSRRIFYFSL